MLTAVCMECEKSISTKFDKTIPKEKDGRPIECRYVRKCPLYDND